MNIHFFREYEHQKPVYYAFVPDPFFAGDWHLTDASTLSDAVYMAYDLLTLLLMEKDPHPKAPAMPLATVKKEAASVGLTHYLGSLPIRLNVRYHLLPNRKGKEPRYITHGLQVVHQGIPFPKPHTPLRSTMLKKAYALLDFRPQLQTE